jgi:hypothetical protein
MTHIFPSAPESHIFCGLLANGSEPVCPGTLAPKFVEKSERKIQKAHKQGTTHDFTLKHGGRGRHRGGDPKGGGGGSKFVQG